MFVKCDVALIRLNNPQRSVGQYEGLLNSETLGGSETNDSCEEREDLV